MPLYLVRITKRRWERDFQESPWLVPNLISADVYADVKVTKGDLSIWHIEDDRSNLNDVITALAVNRQLLAPLDYGLFPQNVIVDSHLTLVHTAGDTPLADANHWHRDLTELTVDKLTDFIKTIFDIMEKNRVQQRVVKQLITSAAAANRIDISQVEESMKPYLQS